MIKNYKQSIMKNKDNCRQVFENWMMACMHGRIGDHVLEEMACNPPILIPDEEVQLSWFDNQNWDVIRAYHGRWYKSASLRIIKEAPDDIVKFYVFYCAPLDEAKQTALIERDVCQSTHLAEEYFTYYHACLAARCLIHKAAQGKNEYFVRLWQRVLMVCYGWEWEFEKKFLNLSIWQQKLKAHYDELTYCKFEEVEIILHSIE